MTKVTAALRLSALSVAVVLAGCVAPGAGGITSNQIDSSAGSMKDRREALKTVRVVQSTPAGWTDMGSISTRRCHRYFTEAQPSEAAMIPDLKMAAYGQGADAIKVIGFQKVNGLAADCWYVLEGSAEMFGKPSR